MTLDPRICFNYDFTDEDQARLVHYASFANQPQHCYHRCGWAIDNVNDCGSLVLGHEFSEHLRTCHGVIGPDRTMLRCCWLGCFAEMKKESLMRHVQEKHLEWKYTCPNCLEQFTRNYTRDQHVSRKHPDN